MDVLIRNVEIGEPFGGLCDCRATFEVRLPKGAPISLAVPCQIPAGGLDHLREAAFGALENLASALAEHAAAEKKGRNGR